MRRLGVSAVVVWTLLGPAARAEASDSAGAQWETMTVIVFNYAKVPSDSLAQAQDFVEGVFRQAGVRIVWRQPLNAPSSENSGSQDGERRLAMRIISDSMITGWANDHNLGFALVPANGDAGVVAGAYYERIEELSHQLEGDPALVLGYVIAHELGHLLLGARSHSPTGIMSYPFGRGELILAAQGRLSFQPAQAKRIRKRVAPRSGLSHPRVG